MKINRTSINVLSNFAAILKKITKDTTEVRDINVHKNYCAAFTPQMIACFFPETELVDENEFSIPDSYPLIMTKDALNNSNFVFKYVPDTAEGWISNEYGLSVKAAELKNDPMNEEALKALLEEKDILCEFTVDTKSKILDLFKNEASAMTAAYDKACFRVYSNFDKPEPDEEGDELIESDDELAQRPVKPKKLKPDYSHIPEPLKYDELDEEGKKLLARIKDALYEGRFEDEEVKSRVDSNLFALKDNLLGGISNELFDEKIAKILTERLLDERIPFIEKFNLDVAAAKKAEDDTVERINSENEERYKLESAEYKAKMKAYEDAIARRNRIRREMPLIAIEMKTENSESIDYIDEIADEAKKYSDFDVYMDYGVFKNLIFNDFYNIKVTNKGFAIISYSGKVTELKGLHYIVSLYEKD